MGKQTHNQAAAVFAYEPKKSVVAHISHMLH